MIKGPPNLSCARGWQFKLYFGSRHKKIPDACIDKDVRILLLSFIQFSHKEYLNLAAIF